MRGARQGLAVLGTVVGTAMLTGGALAAEAPMSYRQAESDIVLQADGRSVQTLHLTIVAGNDGGAREVAQQSQSFVQGLETVELMDGATLKVDGRRLPLGEGAVRVQLAPGSPNVPEYNDIKRVTAIFPDVQAGDAVDVTWRKTVLQPLFPGHFTMTTLFNPLVPWQDARITITAPSGLKLAAQAIGPATEDAPDPAPDPAATRYTWTYRAPAKVDDRSVLSPLDRFPRLFVSSFAGWPEFGDAWAALVEPKLAPDPHIQAVADTVTAGITDKRAQTEAIYSWVSRHVRWAALYVGNGSYVPHEAAQVLANGYGDCKDQVVLTIALLAAKGIVAEPVLLNASSSYTLSGPATLSAFNHVITYVPDLDLYMDTTAGGAPFGTLPTGLYGKPVLRVRRQGSALGRIPVLAPGVAVARTHTVATLDGAGRVTGSTVSEGEGPYATFLRNVAQAIQVTGTERGAAELLRRVGESGTGELELGALSHVGPDYRAVGRFTLSPQPDWLQGEDFHLPVGLTLLPRPGDGTLGPMGIRNLPAGAPTPCHAGEQHEDMALTLPQGRHPDHLPRDRRIVTGAFSYTSHWTFADNTLSVQRDLISTIEQPLCEGKLREEAVLALEKIRHDLNARISLDE